MGEDAGEGSQAPRGPGAALGAWWPSCDGAGVFRAVVVWGAVTFAILQVYLRSLRDDPRTLALERKMKLPPR